MTAPFAYAKSRHVRTLQPGPFNAYQKYKSALQQEFGRKCVYCRMPDTLKGYDGFGVDHYRPKTKFPKLETTYANLYYCCNQCNRRKWHYWPEPALEPTHFIPNPCDHVMFSHLQYEQGTVRAKSQAGAVALECLDLNDDLSVEQRSLLISMIEMAEQRIAEVLGMLAKVEAKQVAGTLGPAAVAAATAALEAELAKLEGNLAKLRGD